MSGGHVSQTSTTDSALASGTFHRRKLTAVLSAAAVHPVGVMSLIVAAATAWIASYSVDVTEWVVMSDELQYAKLATSVFSEPTLLPTLRGIGYDSYSHLYPLLISPLYALFDAASAWRAVHFANALLMASAAIPAYLLTRQLVTPRAAAYVVAAATASVPWVGLSTVVMTENAAYPAFLWAVLAMHVCIARPSARHDVLALAGLCLASLGRTQFLILAAILPIALVLHEFGFALASPGDGVRRRAALSTAAKQLVSQHRVLLGVYVAGGLVMLILGARGSVDGLLGNYGGVTTSGDLFPPSVVDWGKYQLELVIVGAGALPFLLAASWAFGSFVRPLQKAGHAYAVLLLLIVPVLTWEVATFGLKHAGGAIDRYLFYLAPLLFVATAALVLEQRRRPVALLAGTAFYIWFVLSVDLQFGIVPGPYASTPASAFHETIDGRSWSLGNVFGFDDLSGTQMLAWVVPMVAFVLLAVAWFRSRPAAGILTAVLMLGFLVAQTDFVMGRMVETQNAGGGRVTSLPPEERDWVDDAVPDGKFAALVPKRVHDDWTSMRVWWTTELWNKSIEDSYYMPDGRDWTPFPLRLMSVEGDGTIVFNNTSGELADYLVMPIEEEILFRPAGEVVANFKTELPDDVGLELLEVDKPYRAGWLTRGFAADGWLAADQVGRVRVWPHGDAPVQRLRVTLQLEMEAVPPDPSKLTVEADGRVRRTELGAYAIVPFTATVCAGRDTPGEVIVRPTRAIELPDGRMVAARLTRVLTDVLPGQCKPRRGG